MPTAPPSLLILTTSYPLAAGSASGIFVKRLADALASHVRVTVVCPAAGIQSPTNAAESGIIQCRYAPRAWETLAHTPGGIPVALARKPWRWLLVPVFLLSLFLQSIRSSKGKQGILANWSICGLIGGIVAKLRRLPVITTLRGDDVTRAHCRGPVSWVLGLCIAFSHRVAVVSDAMYHVLCERYPHHRHKFFVIHNGVDAEFLNLPPPAPQATIRLLYLGSLIPRKSVHTAICALSKLPEHISLHVVGEGPEETRLRELTQQLGLTARVKFSGQRSPEAIPGLLAESDILVLPSLAEGRPNVVLEAMAAARPVVASNINGTRELLEPDSGDLLFPVGDADAMAACLYKLMDPSTRTRIGQQNRSYITTRDLSWDNAAQGYLTLFDQLCREPH